ncbi:dTMP kinase [Acetivibrio cellulolyticus]|uniref:dTMP kinase n=1 Tax=Acetivibrio cellulolyticus TaxID=35830 RepID=UPI0001E2DEA2|nr:dTMP kinase [Acetivibrio cellulolyticus]
MKRGLFITTEGTDGSGKTTQIKLIESYLKGKGFEVVVTREPGGTSIGEKIRSIILDTENSDMAYITEMMLYASARAQLVNELIKPSLSEGKVVICDRFIDSSYVYQGFGRNIDIELIERVNRIALDGIMPDVTLFFDIDPEVALERRIQSTGADRIEREAMDFHRKVYNGYKKLASMYPDRIKAIESNRNIEEIFSDVKAYLDKFS